MIREPEFDFPSAIKGLAEATGPCDGAFLFDTLGSKVHDWDCSKCSGTGHIVLFAALRVECYNEAYPEFCARGEALCNDPELCNNWVPEPDVEKAASRTYLCLPAAIQRKILVEVGSFTHVSWEEIQKAWEKAVIRAAQEWVKEQHEPE